MAAQEDCGARTMERGARGERGRHGRRRRTRWSSANIFGVVYCLARYCSRCSRHSTESPVCTINYSLRPIMNKSNSRPAVFYRAYPLPRTGVGPGARCKTGAPRARARPAPAPSARKAPGARQPASDNVKGDAVRVSHVTTCVSYQRLKSGLTSVRGTVSVYYTVQRQRGTCRECATPQTRCR